ncbi:hypothetical protein E8E12_001003 [Didymella heteroderae]|uniref:Major facilitator superfamily (MFS) profile domain-containing protein n=1 Tax=Didymella heteroderae TaxID=1769908 RepID=A0A9P5BUX2_9PLEO|nr:hypothetical protein E8E12_001003 [Didymella heteroderae]
MSSSQAITASLDGDATGSFWIGAAYLLAMCISQPVSSRCSNVSGRKAVILTSGMLLGVGSLVSGDSESMILLLLGRTTQGLGAGGLTALAYVVYDDLDRSGLSSNEGATNRVSTMFLTAISCTVAIGTVCGPLIGAVLSHGSDWRWLFRLNLPFCLILGIAVYNTNDTLRWSTRGAAKYSDIDFVAATLSVASLVPLLVGLSFAGSRYEWADWHTLAPISLGCTCVLLFAVWELRLGRSWLPFPAYRDTVESFLGLAAFRDPRAANTVVGSVILGVLMYTLLFFLPIYYRVVKEHDALATSLLLLPQTLMTAPCGAMVVVSVAADAILNLASGVGIGVLLPALTLGAKDSVRGEDATQAPMVLVYMRYLGSASGLIASGLAFQRLLRRNLETTKFRSEAAELTKHATTLMASIDRTSNSEDKLILTVAVQDALSTIWITLSIVCTVVVLLNCLSTFTAIDRGPAVSPRLSTTVIDTSLTRPARPEPTRPSVDVTPELELDSPIASMGTVDKDQKVL